MKWLNQNKFILSVCVIALLAYFCFRFFMQSIRTDHSMELFKQKMEYQEQNIKFQQQLRSVYEAEKAELMKEAYAIKVRDSINTEKTNVLEKKYETISTPKYVKQKINEVKDMDIDAILNYIEQQPEPNDY